MSAKTANLEKTTDPRSTASLQQIELSARLGSGEFEFLIWSMTYTSCMLSCVYLMSLQPYRQFVLLNQDIQCETSVASIWGWHTVEFLLLKTLRAVCPYSAEVRFGNTLSRKSQQVWLSWIPYTCRVCTHMVQGRCRGRVIDTTFFNCFCNHCISPPDLMQLLLSPHWTKAALLHQLLLASRLHGMSAKFIGGLVLVQLTLFSSPHLSGAAGWWPQRGCRQGPAARPIVSKRCVSNTNTGGRLWLRLALVWPGLVTCFKYLYNLKPQGTITKARPCEVFTNCCILPKSTFYSVPSR